MVKLEIIQFNIRSESGCECVYRNYEVNVNINYRTQLARIVTQPHTHAYAHIRYTCLNWFTQTVSMCRMCSHSYEHPFSKHNQSTALTRCKNNPPHIKHTELDNDQTENVFVCFDLLYPRDYPDSISRNCFLHSANIAAAGAKWAKSVSYLVKPYKPSKTGYSYFQTKNPMIIFHPSNR